MLFAEREGFTRHATLFLEVVVMAAKTGKCSLIAQLLTLVVCPQCRKRLGAVLVGARVWCPACHVWTTATATTKPAKAVADA